VTASKRHRIAPQQDRLSAIQAAVSQTQDHDSIDVGDA
jgi:hypothetical protein